MSSLLCGFLQLLLTEDMQSFHKVDEGIEAMLCSWLQQLQEFGGPEVEKPDLLKGSNGSLKNMALSNSMGTNTKAGSGSPTLSKDRHMLDMRARYNVNIG